MVAIMLYSDYSRSDDCTSGTVYYVAELTKTGRDVAYHYGTVKSLEGFYIVQSEVYALADLVYYLEKDNFVDNVEAVWVYLPEKPITSYFFRKVKGVETSYFNSINLVSSWMEKLGDRIRIVPCSRHCFLYLKKMLKDHLENNKDNNETDPD